MHFISFTSGGVVKIPASLIPGFYRARARLLFTETVMVLFNVVFVMAK